MNRTRIEWVKNDDGSQGYTWNPIEGHCPNECWYCYANAMRKRFGWYDGLPRLKRDWRVGSLRSGSTVFVCSMIELFLPGLYMPTSLLTKTVVAATMELPHIRWLFLTKQPSMVRQLLPPLSWLGVTLTGEGSVHTDDLDFSLTPGVFGSFEPLLGDMSLGEVRNLDWVIVGSLNRSGRAVRPENGGTREEWVWPIIEMADSLGIPVFLKEELLRFYPELPRRKDVPWLKATPQEKGEKHDNSGDTNR